MRVFIYSKVTIQTIRNHLINIDFDFADRYDYWLVVILYGSDDYQFKTALVFMRISTQNNEGPDSLMENVKTQSITNNYR